MSLKCEDMITYDPACVHASTYKKAKWSYFQKLIKIDEKENPKRGQLVCVCVCVLYAL